MEDYTFYPGAQYSMEPKYSLLSNSPYTGYYLPPGAFGATTDPRTANQIKAVSDKISTGIKTIEVTGISPEVLEYIPQTHLAEMRRAAKLANVNLTFHGPLIEPTGIDSRSQSWNESDRIQAENQMWSAVERSHELDKDGNIIVTFHSSNGLPEPHTRVKVKGKDGKDEIRTTDMLVVDEHAGKWGRISAKAQKDYLSGKEQTVQDRIKEANEKNWSTNLNNIAIGLERGRRELGQALKIKDELNSNVKKEIESIPSLYNLSQKKPEKYEAIMKTIASESPQVAGIIQDKVSEVAFADVSVQDAYNNMKETFNDVYYYIDEKKDLESKGKLDAYAKKIQKTMESYKKDSSKVVELANEIEHGLRILQSLEPPETLKPIEKFAIDKASDTFANLAFRSYDKFRKSAPIISVENPPIGLGLTRADEIKEIVEKSREKFVRRAVEEGKLSRSHAEKEAEKLIGVTWDVGHINMLKKYGYENKDVIKETEKIAPFVKHIHLSDNFGMEHTELPMGMGNVPIKEELAAIEKANKEKFKDFKKIIETGGWYQHFKTTPLAETFEAFGSSFYGKGSPYWNSSRGVTGDYFSGYGATLPEQHFSTYGTGFSNMPTELGGQMSGKSRMSGTPTE